MELLPYLTSGFGHPSRIDYGTGHESSFVIFLYCLFRLKVLTPEDIVVSRHERAPRLAQSTTEPLS